MKKILIAALAMALLSGTAFAAGGKKKGKAKKANTECCSKGIKNCKPTADCPAIPGCCSKH